MSIDTHPLVAYCSNSLSLIRTPWPEDIPASVYNVAVYSVKEAAQRLGLDTSQVRRLLAKGEIKGVKLARDWVVLDFSYKRKKKPKKKK
jgi:excisionase family DNA binding protein